MIFHDRKEAGEKLARELRGYANQPETVVIALPRGGVVVGYEIASALHLPLDIISPRKIGAPRNPELAIGAITETGEGILSQDLITRLGIPDTYIKKAIEKEKQEAQWRLEHYRQGRPPRQIREQCVILVDDGLATGSTMQAAIKTLRTEGVKKIVLAVPVAPPDTWAQFTTKVDQAICLATPSTFYAVGQFYEVFDQTSDEEVIRLLLL